MYSQAGMLLHKKVGGVTTDYIYAGELLIAKNSSSGGLHYLHTDLLGSPIKGKVGSTSFTEHYSPWGDKKDDPIQLADDVGFTGHQSDTATGLTYMQARYYDPVVGRFMAVDPIGFEPDNSMSFNRYAYVRNNPLTNIDPDGQWGIAGAIYGAISGAVGGIITATSAGGDLIDVAKGAVAGAAAGGAVGFVMPSASTNAGMVAAAAVTGYTSSIAGQAAGNIVNGEDATAKHQSNCCFGFSRWRQRYNSRCQNTRWLPTTGGNVIGEALEADTTNASRAVGNTVASVIEGFGAGAGEAIASELLDDEKTAKELGQ
ncbi:MAG: RHS repeat-associated core domain-containing protein [Woeseiaceae bacterium]|nr:RHS repeat-associated core domain-containing protein [Woeseiaceae bacterium]